ncbi:MAG TPA: hypothetical protein VLQ90_15675 [Pyrinomonadaceae bacterium]|nr:hypothetical protein [Pyrinomonadaceae bacterium]
MFCPSCGSNEQTSQYCRACGTDLRPVRVSLERPDSVTASAVSAREDIGRAVAAKIREVEDAGELKQVAEDVLPQIEKFLESYEEKRLRRVRAGVVTAAAGLGLFIFMALMSAFIRDADALLGVSGLGVATFLIGLGLIINAMFFTKPRNQLADLSADARTQNLLDTAYVQPALRSPTTSNLSNAAGSSITEHTTHHLKTER